MMEFRNRMVFWNGTWDLFISLRVEPPSSLQWNHKNKFQYIDLGIEKMWFKSHLMSQRCGSLLLTQPKFSFPKSIYQLAHHPSREGHILKVKSSLPTGTGTRDCILQSYNGWRILNKFFYSPIAWIAFRRIGRIVLTEFVWRHHTFLFGRLYPIALN